MRADSGTFAAYNEASVKSPRFVVAHIFDVESVYVTSHAGIASVPGVVIENALLDPSAISQRIVPDEGRSDIGSFSFRIVDLSNQFTLEAQEKLGDGISFRGKLVRYYVGYEGMDFTQFQLFQTQVIKDISFEDGIYSVTCADITRQQREEIFDPKKTTLRDSVSDTVTTIPVVSTAGFQAVFHGPSYSDAPNQTVYYFKIEEEIVRATGKTADSFTGCTRGVLNSKAVPHSVDAAASADRRPKIEEYIYLELPAAKLAYAINTGVLHGDSASLPDHWHCGIDTALVKLSDFTGIGIDLWDTALDSSGFVVRFQGLSKVNAKKFLETELYQLLGCYSPIYSDGRIGLKKMNQVLADAAYCVELNESNVVEAGALRHDFSGMHNRLRIDWNWNGQEFTRTTLFLDAASIDIHGAADITKLQFKGLHGSRHTEAMIRKRLDAFRDRYPQPPELISVTVLPSLNRLEVGDVVRLKLAKVRDFAGSTVSINRSFEIQNKSQTDSRGVVTLELFGSTAPASTEAPNDTGVSAALPDAYYDSAGTELSTVCTIVVVGDVGVIQPGTYDLTGNADMNAAGAIYYYEGDLELADGATLTINDNVQIRVRGFLTVNGDIDGVGRGKAGVADAAGWRVIQAGTPGFIGNSRGMDGVLGATMSRGGVYIMTQNCAFTQGQNSAFPFIELQVDGNDLLGIPTDMRGTSGGAGGKLGMAPSLPTFATGTVTALGGTGGDSGAALTIICRGMAFGASALIDLSGADSAATSAVPAGLGFTFPTFPGAGGAGSPGALLILLDGSSVSIPDIGGKFVAACGNVPIGGTPLPLRGPAGLGGMLGWSSPGSGYLDEATISDVDLSNVAYRIQYIPGVETPEEDQDKKPPPPTGISVRGVELGNIVTLTLPDPSLFDVVELYAAITNDRTGAVKVTEDKASVIRHQLPAGVQRYYWARTKKDNIVSDWFPSSSTGGVTGTSVATFVVGGNCEVEGSVARKVGGASAWDSHVYSVEKYLDGAQVTFRPDQINCDLMVGLNADPTTNQSYTSIDYAFNCESNGTLDIYESGVVVVSNISGGYSASSILTIRHDGRRIQYINNGSIVREVVVGTGSYHMDSSFFTPGGQVSRLQFGPANPVRPNPWVARGNCIAGVSAAAKVGGVTAWDSDVYSVESYSTCHVVFKASQDNTAMMVGLNTDPLTDQSYTSIDYAWYPVGDSGATLRIYESGTVVGGGGGTNYGPYDSKTELAITYDGSSIRYLKDRVVVRTTAISNQRFYADASFWSGEINSLRFGPGTSLELTDTPQIGEEAATAVYVATDTYSDTGGSLIGVLIQLTAPAFDVAHKALVTYTGDVYKTNSNGAYCYLARLVSGAPSGTVGELFPIPTTASPGSRAALIFSFDGAAGTAYTYGLWYNSGTVGNGGFGENQSLKVEIIKR
jgi:hypothetical protein